MSEQKSRAVTFDTSGTTTAGGMPGRVGDLASGTMIDREALEAMRRPLDAPRLFDSLTIKAGS